MTSQLTLHTTYQHPCNTVHEYSSLHYNTGIPQHLNKYHHHHHPNGFWKSLIPFALTVSVHDPSTCSWQPEQCLTWICNTWKASMIFSCI